MPDGPRSDGVPTREPSDECTLEIGIALRAFEEFRRELRETLESPKVLQALEAIQIVAQAIRELDSQQLAAINEALKVPQNTLRKADLLGKLGWTLPIYMSPGDCTTFCN
jgi:hypothetical protein